MSTGTITSRDYSDSWVYAASLVETTKTLEYWYGILEGTRALPYNYRDGEGDTAPENFGIYSFREHDCFDSYFRPKDE